MKSILPMLATLALLSGCASVNTLQVSAEG